MVVTGSATAVEDSVETVEDPPVGMRKMVHHVARQRRMRETVAAALKETASDTHWSWIAAHVGRLRSL